MHNSDYRQQIEDRIEQLSAILTAIDRMDEVTTFIASHDEESLEAGLASLVGTSAMGARAILDCQFRRLSPKNRARILSDLPLLKAELGKLGN